MHHPVAIGGVGGSGTRLGAALLQLLDFYIGDDLNGPLDNLWFTLLFKRRSILLEGERTFRNLLSLFFYRASGGTEIPDGQRAQIFELAHVGRLQHSQEWLNERANSFLNGLTACRAGQSWGWKEPNTHIIIDRMFEFQHELKYIHFVRHPLDMALGDNQHQLQNWGPILLNCDVVIEPRQSLAYWCAAHRRILAFMQRWPDRTLMIDFDALCEAPDRHAEQVAAFLGADLPDPVLRAFRKVVVRPQSVGRHKAVDPGQFDPMDLSYVAALGYDMATSVHHK